MRGGRRPSNQAKAERDPIHWRRWGIIVAIVLVVGIVAFVGVAQATDASPFCVVCHEMRPYYDAWTHGGHKTTAQCVDCHVDAGFLPRLTHKFDALTEVWSHFTTTPAYPLRAPAPVPDSRCTGCHPKVAPKNVQASFSHDQHAKQGPCAMCHATVGHDVPAQALQAAGIYSANNAALRVRSPTATALPGSGKANIPGHVTIACSRCHDLAAMGCAACHIAPHEPLGDCGLCHPAGPKFTFAHPPAGEHDWQSIQCRLCHPVSYRQVSCTCHGGGGPTGD
jgi:nitrate/TMAO reductase-like tetraheme cytochrome c subunit